ncbi:hypothetical protein Tco_0757010 [Tanacetum coccineum]
MSIRTGFKIISLISLLRFQLSRVTLSWHQSAAISIPSDVVRHLLSPFHSTIRTATNPLCEACIAGPISDSLNPSQDPFVEHTVLLSVERRKIRKLHRLKPEIVYFRGLSMLIIGIRTQNLMSGVLVLAQPDSFVGYDTAGANGVELITRRRGIRSWSTRLDGTLKLIERGRQSSEVKLDSGNS